MRRQAEARRQGYVIEWAIRFDPCLEVEPGVFYSTSMGDRRMGLNILVGDLDRDEFRYGQPIRVSPREFMGGLEEHADAFAGFRDADYAASGTTVKPCSRKWSSKVKAVESPCFLMLRKLTQSTKLSLRRAARRTASIPRA